MNADPARFFRDMADRIDKNDPAEFGGAILIVPPAGSAGEIEIVDMLLTGSTKDPVFFWGSVKAKIEIMDRESAMSRAGEPFGNFRR